MDPDGPLVPQTCRSGQEKDSGRPWTLLIAVDPELQRTSTLARIRQATESFCRLFVGGTGYCPTPSGDLAFISAVDLTAVKRDDGAETLDRYGYRQLLLIAFYGRSPAKLVDNIGREAPAE